jgi:heat-inducible transcriptional repressor
MPETTLLSDLNDRSREVFRRVVESYLATGEPVGSRTLTRELRGKKKVLRGSPGFGQKRERC